MSRKKSEDTPLLPEPQYESIEITPVEPDQDAVAVDSGSEQDTKGQPVEYVTREEHDRAVKSLRNDISSLTEQVTDLNNLVGAPKDSFEFFEILPHPRTTSEEGLESAENEGWYQPHGQATSEDGDGWYQSPYKG